MFLLPIQFMSCVVILILVEQAGIIESVLTFANLRNLH